VKINMKYNSQFVCLDLYLELSYFLHEVNGLLIFIHSSPRRAKFREMRLTTEKP
jgi:hypothetical protein